ncbi:glycosyltransferase family 8 protein [Mucilaginibacter sp. PAMB04274]|uniref:glycosyltransferase family 8 protein n=1 Tax=Mucilaginibacter sp. PAMB04274 TaxID=3138568 RepID=UPI0031F6864A
MQKELNVFFTIDENYIQHFTVALTSLLENNKDLTTHIYLISDIADFSPFNYVVKYFQERYQTSINLIAIERELFEKFVVSHHLSKAVYFRLLLADILPAHINSGLFLDSDLIVTNSLKELADTDLKDNYLMASHDFNLSDSIAWMNEIGFPTKEYFNAGVLLINLKKWREDNVSDKLMDIAQKFMEILRWWDQDVLNIFFRNKWERFDEKFNSMNLTSKLPVTPTIIHYATGGKPWHYFNNHPYKKLYWKYIKLTPFKNAKPKDFSYTNVLRKNYRLLKKRFNIHA